MLRDLKFPFLYVLEALLLIPLFAGFIGTVAFVAAKPMASLDLNGKSLPPDWAAAYPNRGRYLRGFLIADHPMGFIAVVLVVFASVVMLYLVHKAQLSQLAASGSPRAHKFARGIVFGVWVVLSYTLVMHVLVGVYPK
jgi:hypothetical protein